MEKTCMEEDNFVQWKMIVS